MLVFYICFDISIAYECFNLYWNVFNSKTIKICYIITIHIQSYPMRSHWFALFKLVLLPDNRPPNKLAPKKSTKKSTFLLLWFNFNCFLPPFINKPDSSRDMTIFTISSISLFEIISVVVPQLKAFFTKHLQLMLMFLLLILMVSKHF